jgi:hypothetical protein
METYREQNIIDGQSNLMVPFRRQPNLPSQEKSPVIWAIAEWGALNPVKAVASVRQSLTDFPTFAGEECRQ